MTPVTGADIAAALKLAEANTLGVEGDMIEPYTAAKLFCIQGETEDERLAVALLIGFEAGVVHAGAEIEHLRRHRDDLLANNNRRLGELRAATAKLDEFERQKRLAKEAGQYCLDKWGINFKARGRKLLEESAELMVSLSNEWQLKQYGKAAATNEIGDVQIVLWSIGEMLGVDVNEAALRKFNEVRLKHGPVEAVQS